MSFDLAFWKGDPPVDDDAAGAEHVRLYEAYVGGAGDGEAGPHEPHPELLAFVAEVTARYPDLTDFDDDEVDDAVWSDGPLTGNIAGPYLYLGLSYSRCDEVAPYLIERAQARGLIAFDPQSGKRVA